MDFDARAYFTTLSVGPVHNQHIFGQICQIFETLCLMITIYIWPNLSDVWSCSFFDWFIPEFWMIILIILIDYSDWLFWWIILIDYTGWLFWLHWLIILVNYSVWIILVDYSDYTGWLFWFFWLTILNSGWLLWLLWLIILIHSWILVDYSDYSEFWLIIQRKVNPLSGVYWGRQINWPFQFLLYTKPTLTVQTLIVQYIHHIYSIHYTLNQHWPSKLYTNSIKWDSRPCCVVL